MLLTAIVPVWAEHWGSQCFPMDKPGLIAPCWCRWGLIPSPFCIDAPEPSTHVPSWSSALEIKLQMHTVRRISLLSKSAALRCCSQCVTVCLFSCFWLSYNLAYQQLQQPKSKWKYQQPGYTYDFPQLIWKNTASNTGNGKHRVMGYSARK